MIQSKESRIFTVSAINKYIRGMFDQDYLLSALKVEGEISNYKFDQKGHLYFSLKDETGALSCVMYKFHQQAGIKCRLENGMKCVVTGAISVFERNGTYQLYARQIEEKGIGNLFERFEALKRYLAAEGIFDPAHKKAIPPYCKRIGIVTASTGAVIHDIMNVAARRNPYVQLILCPAKVQGEGAAEEIAQSIQILDSFGLDCLIVGRGGGSMEDLWAFNEEVVVRAVYTCTTPVISAVGHETDTTLCDYAADLRVPTPSAAAEIAVFDLQKTLSTLDQARKKLFQLMDAQISHSRLQLSGCENKLQALHPQHTLEKQKQQLTIYQERLNYAIEKKLVYESQLAKQSRNRLQQTEEQLQGAFQKLQMNRRHALALLAQQLDSLSPVKRLTGGYAYVATERGLPLISIDQIQIDEQISVRTSDGKILAAVKEKKYLSKEQMV